MATPYTKKPKALLSLDPDSVDLIYGPTERAELDKLADFIAPLQTPEMLSQNPSILEEVEVIFSGWGGPIMDEAFLSAAPNLKAYFYGAGATRHITTPEFWERDIIITSSVAANAIPVAEYCVATILMSMKHFWPLMRQTREGKGWIPEGAQLRKVPGNFRSTVGLISLGAIAMKTLDLLDAYDLKRLAYSRSLSPQGASELNVDLASIEEIFQTSDVVSLHTPSLPSTKGMIGGHHFEMMKPGSTFINTARGAVVNEEEMCEVLSKRPDLTAVLDVTDPEPPIPGSPVTQLPNVVLTPHIGGSAGPECQRLGSYMLDEFQRFLAGEELKHQIMPPVAAKVG